MSESTKLHCTPHYWAPCSALCASVLNPTRTHCSYRVMSDRNLSPPKQNRQDWKHKPIRGNSSLDVQIAGHAKTTERHILVGQPTRSTEAESSSQRICPPKATDLLCKLSPACTDSPAPRRALLQGSDPRCTWESRMIEKLLTKKPTAAPRRRSKSPYWGSISHSRAATPIPSRSKSPMPSSQSRTSFSSVKKPSVSRSPDDHRTHQQLVFSEYFPGSFDSAPTSFQTTARHSEGDRVALCFWGVGHKNAVNAVCVRDARVVVSASSDYTLGEWTLPRGAIDPYKGDASVVRFGSVRKMDTLWRGHKGKVLSVAVMAQGFFCSGSEDCCVRVWGHSGSPALIRPHIGPVTAVGHLAASHILVCSGKTVQQYDAAARQCICTFENEGKSRVTSILPVSATVVLSGFEDSSVRMWDTRSGKCVHTLSGHSETVTCLSVLLDGKVMSGSDDCTLRLWDLRSLHPLFLLPSPEPVKSVCGFTESLLFSGGESLFVYEQLSPRALKAAMGTIRSLATVPETDLLVAGGSEGTVGVWTVSR